MKLFKHQFQVLYIRNFNSYFRLSVVFTTEANQLINFEGEINGCLFWKLYLTLNLLKASDNFTYHQV
jgi:hypothetical protein